MAIRWRCRVCVSERADDVVQRAELLKMKALGLCIERVGRRLPWRNRQFAERYGLYKVSILGESGFLLKQDTRCVIARMSVSMVSPHLETAVRAANRLHG